MWTLLRNFWRARKVRPRLGWERELVWFRLRYSDAAGPTKVIQLLSRAQTPGRVALTYQPGDIAQINLAVPAAVENLILQMAADYGFLLTPTNPALPPEPPPLIPAVDLPLNRPFLAHIVNGCLFVAGDNGGGVYFPSPPKQPGADAWRLPSDPPPGVAAAPQWGNWPAPARLLTRENNPDAWILGRSFQGPIQTTGNINVYGQGESTSSWLAGVVTQALAADSGRLAVIDGDGALARLLKRKASITRLIAHNQLAFVDMDGASAQGFNPLLPAAGESDDQAIARWTAWFSEMGAHPSALALLPQAYRDGVRDLAALNRWLITVRSGHFAAVTALTILLEQVMGAMELSEWLRYPGRYINDLTEGSALIFSIKAHNWERRQFLWAVLLAVAHIPNLRLVIHGLPAWQFDAGLFNERQRVIVTNGPTMAGTTILVGCKPTSVEILAGRFLGNDPLLTENLRLLQAGDGIVIHQDAITFVTWRNNL
jgi:hypothetical protein